VRKSARVFPDLVPSDVERRAGPKTRVAVMDDLDLLPALAFVICAAASVLFLSIAG
jgi:hypothetical protein